MAVWDTAKIELVASVVYPDPDGEYVRDPWAVHLREVASGIEFALLAIHARPSAAEAEVMAMGAVLDWASSVLADDVLLVGDYNADGSYVDEDTVWSALFGATYGDGGTLGDAFVQVVDNSVDTTVAASSNTYDRMIISASFQSASVAAGGGAGDVFAFDQELDLSDVWTEGCGAASYISTSDCEQRSTLTADQANRLAAQEISDHFPVELALCINASAVASTASQGVDSSTESQPANAQPAHAADSATSKSCTQGPHILSLLVLLHATILCTKF